MRANLAKQEIKWLQHWETLDLYQEQRKQGKGRPLFVLHDGPPYANGHIHLGHALNILLKDFVTRFRWMQGYDVSFVPGWDCHGLPIEAKVEERLDPHADVVAFRMGCREFAQGWIEIQKGEFQRLGVVADWKHPYTTMDYGFEARILHHLYSLMEKGYVYRGMRPVWWSSSEKTALAEAEIEYETITSKAIFVKFPLQSQDPVLQDTSAVIWTTTPWSLPGNRAICYATCSSYGVYQVKTVQEGSLLSKGEKLLLGMERAEFLCEELGITLSLLKEVSGTFLQGLQARHPLWKEGYTFSVPMLPSEFVTMDTGTGLVHTAPGHGMEDFVIGKRYHLEIASPIGGDGCFLPTVPLFSGMSMDGVYPVLREALVRYNALAGEKDYAHSYPHSWRSKKPLFSRATSQWFISLDGSQNLRKCSLDAIDEVTWFPETGASRLRSMIQNRPDWCISRQRTWGVPIAEFVHTITGEPMNDSRVRQRIQERVAQEGVDFWFTDSAFEVLEGLYAREDWTKNQDILDVWFESGVTHMVVLQDVEEQGDHPIAWPASLYLEGSDQHRGWFQSSLCTAVALRGQAPYQEVVTHGFLLDERGRKMSKSLGNVICPEDIVAKDGADMLRLWVAYEDYQRDLRLGPKILERVRDMYRRLRNTLRYLLGMLSTFKPEHYHEPSTLSFLNQWMHHRLYTLNQHVSRCATGYQFQSLVHELHSFCNEDLSSFYFDVCKDSLYCDSLDNLERQGIMTTLFHALWCLMHWLAPILPFTIEEAWHHFLEEVPLDLAWIRGLEFNTVSPKTIHLNTLPVLPEAWHQPLLQEQMQELRRLRGSVTEALEVLRKDGKIKGSLEAFPTLTLQGLPQGFSLESFGKWMELVCITSGFKVQIDPSLETLTVDIQSPLGEKCLRCWKITSTSKDQLCERCVTVEK